MTELTHLNEQGAAHMVDVGEKAETQRVAVARGRVRMAEATLDLLRESGHKKGDVLAVARIAGIQAAKKCSDFIPLCHPLMLEAVDVSFDIDQTVSQIAVTATCRVSGKTGVEMEALTAASVAALTIYDMCKSIDKTMVIGELTLWEKHGGRTGTYRRSDDAAVDTDS